MTITPAPITGFPIGGQPYTNITPFTYRDGLTYIEVLERLRNWLKEELTPWLNATVGELNDAWQLEVGLLLEQVNDALVAQALQVNTEIGGMVDYVNNAVQEMITEIQNSTAAETAAAIAALEWDARVAPAMASARIYAANYGTGAVPVVCRATRTSDVTISHAVATPIAFTTEDIDTHSIHDNSADQTRFSVPPGLSGFWQFTGQIAFKGNAGAAGDSGGHREVSLTKNGGAAFAIKRQPAITDATRATIVQIDSGIIALREGDYVEISAYQNRGSGSLSLDIGGSTSWLEGHRVGERVGTGGSVTFASDFKYKGHSAYIGGAINEDKIEFIDDPVRGASRIAAKFPVTNADDQVTYPRIQLSSPFRYASGDDIYVGYSVYIPNDITDLSGTKSLVIGEVYGPPQNGYGPNVFRIRHNLFALEPERLYSEGPEYTPTGKFLSWSLPIEDQKGKWTFFVHRVKLSNDPGVGLHQLWVDIGNGAGLVLQTLNNPDTGIPVGTTLNLATLRTGVNDGANNAAVLKAAYTDYSVGTATIIYGPHRVATNMLDADTRNVP